jgi:hypothetical protein
MKKNGPISGCGNLEIYGSRNTEIEFPENLASKGIKICTKGY